MFSIFMDMSFKRNKEKDNLFGASFGILFPKQIWNSYLSWYSCFLFTLWMILWLNTWKIISTMYAFIIMTLKVNVWKFTAMSWKGKTQIWLIKSFVFSLPQASETIDVLWKYEGKLSQSSVWLRRETEV